MFRSYGVWVGVAKKLHPIIIQISEVKAGIKEFMKKVA
jgi:hypothetical protein